MFSQALALGRYRFHWLTERPIHLPEYAGSALRGVFGHELKKLSCMLKQPDCRQCPLYRTCPYPAIFAPPPPVQPSWQSFSQIPVPYVIEAPEWGRTQYQTGDEFYFDLVLTGQALQQLPLLTLAWQRGLQRGLGSDRGTAQLQQVQLLTQTEPLDLYDPASRQLRPHASQIQIPPYPGCDSIQLSLQTPMRLQQNGKRASPKDLTASLLLNTLVRRLSLMSEFHLGHKLDCDFAALKQQSQQIQSDHQLHWQDWQRYSSRQEQKMTLGGWLGQWRLSGNLAPFWPFLYLGQYLHLGKETSFGLGKYRLDWTSLPEIVLHAS